MKVLTAILVAVTAVVAVVAATSGPTTSAGQKLSPVVFLPGTGGSRLEARHLKKPVQHSNKCSYSSTWYRLWLNVWNLLFADSSCFTETIRLVFNQTTGSSRNMPGVDIRVPGWGHTDTVEHIDPSWTAWSLGNIGEYAAPLIEALVKLGYVRGHSVRAAPYDFRYAPHSSPQLMANLKALIEETYTSNNNQKVTLLAHSLGGLYGMYFLRQQSQAWKDQYIAGYVSISTPWTGVAGIMQLHASGSTFGAKTLDPWVFRSEQRTQETNIYMLPTAGNTAYDWHQDEVLMITPHANYTVANLDKFFVDIGFPTGNAMRRQFENDAYALRDPGTPFHCIHSSGVPVTGRMIYTKGWDVERTPKVVEDDGDGAVNIRSLRGCAKVTLGPDGAKDFHMMHIPGQTHNGIFKDERLHQFLQKVLVIGDQTEEGLKNARI